MFGDLQEACKPGEGNTGNAAGLKQPQDQHGARESELEQMLRETQVSLKLVQHLTQSQN